MQTYGGVNQMLGESSVWDGKEGYKNKTKDNYTLRFSWQWKQPQLCYESNTSNEPLTQAHCGTAGRYLAMKSVCNIAQKWKAQNILQPSFQEKVWEHPLSFFIPLNGFHCNSWRGWNLCDVIKVEKKKIDTFMSAEKQPWSSRANFCNGDSFVAI